MATLPAGQLYRDRLVDLALGNGLMVPAEFVGEVQARKRRLNRGYALFKQTAMSVVDCQLLATTESGRETLARMGIKADPPSSVNASGLATFSSPAAQADDEREGNKLLALTESGREVLLSRGLRQSEVDELQRAGRGY